MGQTTFLVMKIMIFDYTSQKMYSVTIVYISLYHVAMITA